MNPPADAGGTDSLLTARCSLLAAHCSPLTAHLLYLNRAVTNRKVQRRAAIAGADAKRMGRDAVSLARLKIRVGVLNLAYSQDLSIDVAVKARHKLHVETARRQLYLCAQAMPTARRDGEIDRAPLNYDSDSAAGERKIRDTLKRINSNGAFDA